MWLINTTTLALENVGSCKVNDYAILSHTWDEDEVTFQEFQLGSGQTKKGYEKIVETCRQAREDGLEWAWIDTCCINKESSAELSESINSMWEWYRGATECYVYLSDLEYTCPELSDECPHTLWLDQLGQCRWFTRGWTLQELLAPKSCKFYGIQWNRIGTKAELIQTLSTHTGIDQEVLEEPRYLFDLAIARKMSWAAGRKTSRIEDQAYSLLGIFGVNMPLLYGEGERAFIRLQEEIIKTSTDQSIFAWEISYAAHGYSDVFAPAPDNFRYCNGVERREHRSTDYTFHLTNRGLVFEKLLVYDGQWDDDTVTLAVLNCGYKTNLDGPIGLRLYALGQMNPFHSRKKYRSKKQRYEDDARDDTFYVLCNLRSRVQVCSDFVDGANRERRITLLRPTVPLGEFAPMKQRPPRIRLTKNAKLNEVLRYSQGSPPKAWDLDTGVMYLPRTSIEPRRLDSEALSTDANITVIDERSNSRFYIAFFLMWWNYLWQPVFGDIATNDLEPLRFVCDVGSCSERYGSYPSLEGHKLLQHGSDSTTITCERCDQQISVSTLDTHLHSSMTPCRRTFDRDFSTLGIQVSNVSLDHAHQLLETRCASIKSISSIQSSRCPGLMAKVTNITEISDDPVYTISLSVDDRDGEFCDLENGISCSMEEKPHQ